MNWLFEKPRVVQFSNGLYGVRRKRFGICTFLDLRSDHKYWWSVNSPFISHCMTTMKELAEELTRQHTDIGRPV